MEPCNNYAASMISSLFLDDVSKACAEKATSQDWSAPSASMKIQYNSNMNGCGSTKALDRYIHLYEQNQTLALARTMTEICTTTPIKRGSGSKSAEPSTLGREIKMAQTLLSSTHFEPPSDSSSRLSVDDLLNASDPYTASVKKFADQRYTTSDSHLSAYLAASSPFQPRSRRRQRIRKALQFSPEDPDSSDKTLLELCRDSDDGHPRTRASDQSQTTTDIDVDCQVVADVERTKRLVNDLKADLLSTNSSLHGLPFPDRESLTDLINHLSAAAVRKEETLLRSTRSRMFTTLRDSDQEEISTLSHSSNGSSSCGKASHYYWQDGESFDMYSLNGVSYTPHHRKYEHLRREISQTDRAGTETPDTSSVSFLARSGSADETLVESDQVRERGDATNQDGHAEFVPPSRCLSDKSSTILTSDDISEAMRLIDQRTLRSNNEIADSKSSSTIMSESSLALSEFSRKQDAGQTPGVHQGSVNLAPKRETASSPTLTERILDGDRTWEKIPTRRKRRSSDSSSHISVSFQLEGKPTVVKDFMEDCLASSTSDTTTSGLSGSASQPGSVEALKNMIFALQGLAQHGARDSTEPASPSEGERSLRRAMEHLTNLKSIVQR